MWICNFVFQALHAAHARKESEFQNLGFHQFAYKITIKVLEMVEKKNALTTDGTEMHKIKQWHLDVITDWFLRRKKKGCERHGLLKNVHLQSMLAARRRLNQRSCAQIIATREPVPVSHLHILSYRSQSPSATFQQIAACDVISRQAGSIKTFLLKSFFRAAYRFTVWCWFSLMETGEEFHIAQLQRRRLRWKQVCSIEALCIFISKWGKIQVRWRMGGCSHNG